MAAIFDGAGRIIINHSSAIDISGALTISMNIKPIVTTGYYTRLIGKTDGYLVRLVKAGYIQFEIWNGTYPYQSNFASISGTTILQPNLWYHIAAVFTPSSPLKLYINGVLEGTGSVSFSQIGRNTNRLLIGIPDWMGSDNRAFEGYMKDIRIYNSALTSTEISNISSGISYPPTTNLKLLLTLDQRSGGAVDSSPTPNTIAESSFSFVTPLSYITSKGGWNKLLWVGDILRTYKTYMQSTSNPVEFNPTWNEVLAMYYYYLGDKSNGDKKLGVVL